MYINKFMCKSSIIVVFILSTFLSMASTSWPAIYYIDINHPSASDVGPGTESKPWKHCPGMVGWTGSTKLNAGDIVYFNSSDTWTASSGSQLLNVTGGVTYDGDTWGSGERATFKGNTSFAKGLIYIADDHASYETVVKGIHINVNGPRTTDSGICINRPSLKDLIGATKRIINCEVENVTGTVNGYGIRCGANKNRKTDNIEIINNIVHNTRRSGIVLYAAVTSSANQIRNVIIRGNIVYDTGIGADTGGNGILMKNNVQNSVAEYNYVYNTYGRGMNVDVTAGLVGPSNVKFRYNIIRNSGKDGFSVGNTGSNRHIEFYGNLVLHSQRAAINCMSNLGNTHITLKIYNNTLFGNNRGDKRSQIEIASSLAIFDTLEIKNNIIYSTSSQYEVADYKGGRITELSNNIYYKAGGGTRVKNGSRLYDAADLNLWEPTALTTDPLLKNVSSLPTGFIGTHGVDMRPNTEGFNIVADSPAKDYSVSVGTPYSGSINTVRTYGAGRDVGAYEYTDCSDLAPVSNIRVIDITGNHL